MSLNYVQSINRSTPKSGYNNFINNQFSRAESLNYNNKDYHFQLNKNIEKNNMSYNLQFEESNSALQFANLPNSSYYRNNHINNQIYSSRSSTDSNNLNLNNSYNSKPIKSNYNINNRNVLPPPPQLPPNDSTNDNSYFSQLLNNNDNHYHLSNIFDFNNVNASFKMSSDNGQLNEKFQERLLMKSPAITSNSFVHRQNKKKINNVVYSSSLGPSNHIIKYKKPPSYEESLRKIVNTEILLVFEEFWL